MSGFSSVEVTNLRGDILIIVTIEGNKYEGIDAQSY
jgi:hypothetical protein